ncbi:MAG: hypothetical protein ACFFAT_08805 [Promethearchaeota archaeon]
MKKVKGALLKFFVKGVRANKSGVYETIIPEEDIKIINTRILDAAWYPFTTFKNSFNAIVKVFAKGDMNIVYKMGYNAGKETIERLYRGPMMKRQLRDAVDSYNNLFKLWFNFGKQYGKIESENELNIYIEEFDPDFEAFYHVARGWMSSFFEGYLDTKVTTKFLEKSWNGDTRTVVNITWNF